MIIHLLDTSTYQNYFSVTLLKSLTDHSTRIPMKTQVSAAQLEHGLHLFSFLKARNFNLLISKNSLSVYRTERHGDET